MMNQHSPDMSDSRYDWIDKNQVVSTSVYDVRSGAKLTRYDKENLNKELANLHRLYDKIDSDESMMFDGLERHRLLKCIQREAAQHYRLIRDDHNKKSVMCVEMTNGDKIYGFKK